MYQAMDPRLHGQAWLHGLHRATHTPSVSLLSRLLARPPSPPADWLAPMSAEARRLSLSLALALSLAPSLSRPDSLAGSGSVRLSGCPSVLSVRRFCLSLRLALRLVCPVCPSVSPSVGRLFPSPPSDSVRLSLPPPGTVGCRPAQSRCCSATVAFA